ncbi:transposase [Bordetella genomosp. 13]|uniref:transposase n=1 Tax=Bordetella genomosp. 13 TaxID=463040 RepID=UPI0011A6D82F|nr:transposase [Bordetella genomosp. 13]
MQVAKVGMKELDRHLGKVMAHAQRQPIAVSRRGAPWVWIIPDLIWEHPNPWANLVPEEHPLHVLRERVDAQLRQLSGLMPRVADACDCSLAADVLLRVIVLRQAYGVDSDNYLRELLTYDMLCRWFVGLPHEGERADEAVQAACRVARHPGLVRTVEGLLVGIPFGAIRH